MPKVTIIGAGSAEFATELMTDILMTPALASGVFALVDINPERLELSHRLAEYLINQSGSRWTVEASTDRNRVLPGSDYVINTIEVAGLPNARHDYEIPLKFGVDQCIGDTIGPGGLFKALRTLPAWLEILADVERQAPRALVMNYTNPMSLTVLTGLRASSLSIVGLCHSVQHTSLKLAKYLNIPLRQISWQAAGINHLSWFTRLERDGEDLYPLLHRRAQEPQIYENDPVRFEMMFHLGAFPTESSGHVSEYTSYFRKRPDLIRRYARSGYRGESGYYAKNWPRWVKQNEAKLVAILSGQKEFRFKHSQEYAANIMKAISTNTPTVIFGNVLNSGWIDNLPQDGVVEVECLVDQNGIHPTRYGLLPAHLAHLDRQHMTFHDLVATAILEKSREAAFYALVVDPLTAAVCSLEEIRAMFEEMVAVQKQYLPEFL